MLGLFAAWLGVFGVAAFLVSLQEDLTLTLRAAEALGVGMIVMGSRGLGAIPRMLIGSVSDSVVRHAHCPVFVVRD